MVILFLELLILVMEPYTKDLYKMDKNQAKQLSKDQTDFITPDISNTINLMVTERFTISINQHIQVTLETDLRMEKVEWSN